MTKRVRGYGLRVLVVLPVALIVAVVCSPSSRPPFVHRLPHAVDRVGVLVIAHGGSTQWDQMVHAVVQQARLPVPSELALGMGMHPPEVHRLQEAVTRLEQRGVTRIVVVPLLISSHSEVFRQQAYLFGLRRQAEWPEAGMPLNLHVPVVMGEALDDSPVVADILLDRARALSRAPEHETVILVAHGPNTDADNRLWLETMRRVGERIKREGGFRDVAGFTIRDDAPAPVQEQAKRQLRDAIRTAAQESRVLVVPLLMARGGVEDKIPKLLEGLPYLYKGDTLLPHPKVAQWIAQQAAQLAREPRPFRISRSVPNGLRVNEPF